MDELPMEILLKIFGYLGFSDVKAAGSTCKALRSVLYDNKFNRNVVGHFMKEHISNSVEPGLSLINCDRPLQNLYFQDVTFGEVERCFDNFSDSVTSLTLENSDILQKSFWPLLFNFKKLTSLAVINCSQLFMFSSYSETYDEFYDVLSEVTNLSLANNQYLTDASLNRFTTPIKKIVSLDLSGCHIAYHYAIQRRFYPANCHEKPSDSILTYLFILKLLKEHKDHIADLNFSNTSISITALKALTDWQQGCLQLRKLWLSNCRQLNANFSNFLKTQYKLQVLDLSNTMSVDDTCMEVITNNFPTIQELNIQNSSLITNRGAINLKKLQNLRYLNIAKCINITTEGIIYGIASVHNTTLVEFDMSCLNVFPEAIKAVALNLPELRYLNVGNCVHGVTDATVQTILEHLVNLEQLCLEGCNNITDVGLTGINIAKLAGEEQTDASSGSVDSSFAQPSSSASSSSYALSGLKISLRSKAEEEIVRDANRKKFLMKAHELSLIDEQTIEGFSINRLKRLKVLSLSNCNKITDVTLKYGLKFPELKSLSLARCQQISNLGIEGVATNTPSIEELNLTDCCTISDKAIKAVTEKLTRLKVLHISGCSQLTDHSLDAIIVNCKCLRTLSVHRCRQMYSDIEERLSNLHYLKNIYMDNAVNIDNAELLRFKKRFDY